MEKSRSYSGLFIIFPEKQEEIDQVKRKIGSIITDNSGNVEKEDMVGKRTLAYPIKKRSEGIYYEVVFTAMPSGVAKMMKEFQINTDIMRALIDKND